MRMLVAALAFSAATVAGAAESVIKPSDFTSTGVWKVADGKLSADKAGAQAEAIASMGVGPCIAWVKAAVGSDCVINVNGVDGKVKPEGKAGEYVWVQPCRLSVPAGWVGIMLKQSGTARSSVEEIILTDNAEFKPAGCKTPDKKEKETSKQ